MEGDYLYRSFDQTNKQKTMGGRGSWFLLSREKGELWYQAEIEDVGMNF